MKLGHNLFNLYTSIKNKLILRNKTLLITFSEVGTPEEYMQAYGRRYKFIIPVNLEDTLKPDTRYLQILRNIFSDRFPSDRIVYNYNYTQTKKPAILDLNSVLYRVLRIYGKTRLKTSTRFMKLLNLEELLTKFKPEGYQHIVLQYIIDLDKLDIKKLSLANVKELYLGLIFKLLKDDKFPLKQMIITVKKDGTYYSFLAYLNGKFSFQKILSIINAINSKTKEDRIKEVEEKLPAIEKKIAQYVEDEDDRLTIVNSISQYLISNPTEPVKATPDAVKEYIANILKEETQEATETRSFKELTSRLLKLKVPNFVIKSKHIPTDTLSEVIMTDKVVGNAINSRKYLIKEGMKYQIDLFKNYYEKKYGIKTVSIDEEDVETDDIKPSTLKRMVFTFKDSKGKTFKLALKVPRLESNFFYINGKKRSLLYQLFPSPVQNVKAFTTLLKTNYTSISFISKTKFKNKGLFVYVSGYEVPYVIFLLGAFKDKCSRGERLCNECVDFMFKAAGVRYKVSETKPPKSVEKYSFNFGGKWYYLPENATLKERQIMWSFRVFYKKFDKNPLRDCDQLEYRIGEEYHGRILDNIKQISDNILDPVTVFALKSEGIPTTRYKLFNHCVDLAISGVTSDQADLSKKRLRNAEILGILLFKNLNKVLVKYHAAQVQGKKFEPKLDENSIINTFTSGDVQSQFQLVEDNNPLNEASLIYRTTYSGYQGISTEFATPEQRTVHPSQFCNLDPVDSPDSRAVGVIRNLAVQATLEKSIGKFKIHSMDEECNTFSLTTLYSPFVRNNDGNRLQFVSSQLKSDVPLKNPQLPLVTSSYSNAFINFVDDTFVVRSPVTGIVKEITDDYIVIFDKKSQKQIAVPFPPQKMLTEGSGVTYSPRVSLNQPVKQGDVIISADNFFKTDFLTLGVNAHTGFMPYDIYNFEDGIVVSESFANATTSTHVVEQEILFKEDETVVPSLLPSIGDEVDGSKPIFKIAPLLGLESSVDMFLEFSDSDFEDDTGEDIGLDVSNDEDSDGEPTETPEQGEEITSGLYRLIYPNVTKGVIKSIEIFSKDESTLKKNKPLYTLWKSIKGDVERKIKSLKSQKVDTSYLESKYKNILDPFGKKYNGEELDGTLVKITYYYEKKLEVGDKLHNRHGNKGVVTKILPDDQMPRTKLGRPLDILINLVGVIGRKNAGQFIELYLGKIVHYYNEQVKKELEKHKTQKALNLILDMYKKLHPDKSYVKLLEQKFAKMSDSEKEKFLEQVHTTGIPLVTDPVKDTITIERIAEVLKGLNLPDKEILYVPEIGRYTRKPVATGYMYWMKTKHMSAKKMHARSIGKREGKTLQAAQGKKQEGGQRYSEIDIMNLYTYDLKNFMAEIISLSSDDIQTKMRVINSIIRNGKVKLTDVEQLRSTSGEQFKVYLECMGIIEPS